MTILELTIVILVLMGLVGILFIGVRGWKRGSDSALCIINIQSVQKGVRSYANLYGFAPGDSAPNLQNQVIGPGKFVETTPTCFANGIYSFGRTYGNNKIPPLGELYMQCSLAGNDEHEPPNHADW